MYLIAADYLRTIQDVNLQQLISNDPTIQAGAELAAEAEAKSYLRQKYDISQEFKSIDPWNVLQSYKSTDRIILKATAYDSTNTYTNGDVAGYQNKAYVCNTAGTTGTWDASKWDLLGNINDLYYAIYPKPLFDLQGYYNKGDQVFWKDKIYTAVQSTVVIDHDTALQFRTLQNVPYLNVYPDEALQGKAYWGTGTPYYVPASTAINDTDFWTLGDNRDKQMVQYVADIALYHLHSRISPRNIPDLRIKRYDHAIKWLTMCAKGEITPELPPLSPRQGQRIRVGGNIKNINSY
jgi:hypothetical protein